jgi:hypothetical protein
MADRRIVDGGWNYAKEIFRKATQQRHGNTAPTVKNTEYIASLSCAAQRIICWCHPDAKLH